MNNTLQSELQQYLDKLGLANFLPWWLGELKALIPARIIENYRTKKGIVRFQVGTNNITVARYEEDNPSDIKQETLPFAPVGSEYKMENAVLAGFDPANTRIEVSLLATQTLEKAIELPMAVEENLAQVLTFEIDRYTPFRPEQAYFYYRIKQRLPEEEKIQVSITVTPRHIVHTLIERINRWGIHPTRVFACPEDCDFWNAPPEPELNLLPPTLRPQERKPWGKLTTILSASAVLTCIVTLALPLAQKQITLNQLRTLVKQANAEAKSSNALQDKLDHIIKTANFLVEKKQSMPIVITTLNELTKMLPNDNWIHLFEQNNGEIRIQGKSPAASNLISEIEGNQLFTNSRFRSPVTRDPRSGLERFHLSADIYSPNTKNPGKKK